VGLAREELNDAFPTLSEVYPAVAESVPLARESLTAFASAAGATGHELDEIRLAVSEAATNVVLHAYRDRGGYIYFTAALAGDELWILVTDRGSGLHAGSNSQGLGFGLPLISQVSDEFAIVQPAAGGTEVRMRFALRSPRVTPDDQGRGSLLSARSPASPSFSTIT
jgi:anti-sigma regulatory factor (Ser/Thr protein kinase)